MQLRFLNIAAATLLLCLFVQKGRSEDTGGSHGKKAVTALEVKASGPKTFYFDGRAGGNQISIQSESTLEDFTTVCNQVTGELQLDPKHLETLKGKFSLRVQDLRTGIDLRDHHLQSPEWLDAAKYPEVAVEIDDVRDVKKTGANEATLVMVGRCTVHGKTNKAQVPGSLTYLDESPKTMIRAKGDIVRIRGDFAIKLSDYAVSGPKDSDTSVGLKVSDVQKIKITVFGSTERPPAALTVDKGAATQQATARTRKAGVKSPSLKAPTRPAPKE